MTLTAIQTRQSEKGFTLVELAIVMIIIGLLIGGILKGQELINNSRVTATVSQAKAVEAGVSTFRDKYAGFPGDILTPNQRIPNCTGLCNNAGNADGLVQGATAGNPGAANAASEGAYAFAQLGTAGMIGGVQGTSAAINVIGASNPSTPVGGAWQFGYGTGTGAAAGLISSALGYDAGHYIVTVTQLGTAAAAGNAPLTAVQAANIDRKLDDGAPNTGIVRAVGTAGAVGSGNCAFNALAAGTYNESDTARECGLYVKVQ